MEPNLFEDQVRANLPKLEERPEFAGDRVWLTFYLCAPPENLERVAVALGKSGWTNLGSWEGGFLYPKVQVEKAVAAIVETAGRVQQSCAEEGAEIIHIDADTTPDMNSRCVILYHLPA